MTILKVGMRFKNCFGVYSYSATTLVFYISFNSHLILTYFWGHLAWLLGAHMVYFLPGIIFGLFWVQMGYFGSQGRA